jgi:hypothetical protein
MRDDTIRLATFRLNFSDFLIIASRFSDGKVDVFYASDILLARYSAFRAFPDVRKNYACNPNTVPPKVRALIRASFDFKGTEWLL